VVSIRWRIPTRQTEQTKLSVPQDAKVDVPCCGPTLVSFSFHSPSIYWWFTLCVRAMARSPFSQLSLAVLKYLIRWTNHRSCQSIEETLKSIWYLSEKLLLNRKTFLLSDRQRRVREEVTPAHQEDLGCYIITFPLLGSMKYFKTTARSCAGLVPPSAFGVWVQFSYNNVG
jgi:hypothetical protein